MLVNSIQLQAKEQAVNQQKRELHKNMIIQSYKRFTFTLQMTPNIRINTSENN